MTDGATVIDTPEGIAYFHALQLKHGLSLEIKTGMKMSGGSVMKQVNREYGTKFTRKQPAFEFMCAIVDYMKGDDTATERINAVLAPQGLSLDMDGA